MQAGRARRADQHCAGAHAVRGAAAEPRGDRGRGRRDRGPRRSGHAVSMRRVAAVLGSGTMSLYRHVASREQLLDLMIDSAYSGIGLPARPSGAWRHDLALLAHAQRRMMRAHPWAALLVGSRPPVLAGFLRPFEFALAALTGAGLEITDAAGAAGDPQRVRHRLHVAGARRRNHAAHRADEGRLARPQRAAGRAHPCQRRLPGGQPVRRACARPRPGNRVRDRPAPHPRRHPGIAARTPLKPSRHCAGEPAEAAAIPGACGTLRSDGIRRRRPDMTRHPPVTRSCDHLVLELHEDEH